MLIVYFQACRAKDVDCIVAPYEADAQLAYLNKIGVAQIIITEDSDLVLFGCDKVCNFTYMLIYICPISNKYSNTNNRTLYQFEILS